EYTVTADIFHSNLDGSGRQVMVLERVVDEIAKHAFQRRLVGDKGLGFGLHRDAKARGPRQHFENAGNQALDIDLYRSRKGCTGPSVRQQIVDYAFQALHAI